MTIIRQRKIVRRNVKVTRVTQSDSDKPTKMGKKEALSTVAATKCQRLVVAIEFQKNKLASYAR